MKLLALCNQSLKLSKLKSAYVSPSSYPDELLNMQLKILCTAILAEKITYHLQPKISLAFGWAKVT